MPDGKVDKVVGGDSRWHAPVWGVDLNLDLAPDWQALQDWNNATVGVGLSYWNMGHKMLGHAIAPYIYMNIPLVQHNRFELGLRPGLGAAFMTKTYRNTVPPDELFQQMNHANQSIGSVTNLYFPEELYICFPLAQGWSLSLSGGWYHISNGSVRQPNSGYNIFGGELGVRKQFDTNEAISREAIGEKQADNELKKWSVAIVGTMGGRQVYYKDQQTFMVASMHAASYWHAHPIFRLGAGVDVFYDGAYIQRATDFRKTNLDLAQPGDCWRVGVSIQPEFVVGNFTAGLHIGAYMHDPVKALEPQWKADGLPQQRLDKPIFYAYDLLNAGSAGYPDGWLYTSVALRYHLPWHMFVQAMMKSHLTKVEFVSLGLGFYY